MPDVKNEFVTLKVSDGTEMRAFVAHTPGATKLPGLLVFQEAFGANQHIRDVTMRFAREGFLAIAPELFHRTAGPGFEGSYSDFSSVMPHVSALRDASMVADIRAAHGWLQEQNTIDAERIASVGFCMGGRVSFLADVILPLGAAISFYRRHCSAGGQCGAAPARGRDSRADSAVLERAG